MKNYMVVPKDVRESRYLLFDSSVRGIKLRESYSDLRCDQCGKIEELVAFKRGISDDIVFPKKMPDFFSSEEGIDIVSIGMRALLDSVGGVDVAYFPFPADDRFFVAWPRQLIRANAQDRALRTEGICQKCRRPAECLIGTELYPFAKDFVLGALSIECPTNLTPLWIASERVFKCLSAARLSGLEFHPYFKI